MDQVKVGIVITCFNSVNYTANAIQSIRTTFPYSLVVVDDFSTDGTKPYLQSMVRAHNNLWVQTMERNWEDAIVLTDIPTNSLGEKWNLGVETASEKGCQFVFVCNNDILFSPYTIDAATNRWIKAKENNERIAIVSALNKRGELQPNTVLTMSQPTDPTEAESPDFSCFGVDVEVWKEVGKFPTVYEPCYFEDGDFHCTLAKNNYTAIATTAAPYYHFGSVTQNSVPGGLCKGPQFEKLREIFRTRWGFVPGDPEYDAYVHRKLPV